jgi:hypothetical protein
MDSSMNDVLLGDLLLATIMPPPIENVTVVAPSDTAELPSTVTVELPSTATAELPSTVTDELTTPTHTVVPHPPTTPIEVLPTTNNKVSELVTFHLRIDASVRKIVQDGKINKHDIPELVFLITELALAPPPSSASIKLTDEMINTKMNEMYNYIMTHYSLYPADEAEKESFKQLFEMSMRLVLFQPNLKKGLKSCFSCFTT